MRGVPYLATGFAAPISFNAAEPTDLQDLATTVWNLQLDHAFSSALRLNAYVRYFDSTAPQAYHEPNTYNAATGLRVREFRHQLRRMYESSAGTHVIADFDALALTAFPITGALLWLAVRWSTRRLRFTAIALLTAAGYLALVTLFQ